MEIVKIISEWKKTPKTEKGQNKKVKRGFKRVEAIVKTKVGIFTRHIDIKI